MEGTVGPQQAHRRVFVLTSFVWRRKSRQWSRMWNSPPLMNKSKMHEKFSLKINWRFTERFLHNQGLGRKGREVIRLGPPRGFGIGGGFYTGRELSKEVSGLSHVLGTPTLGSDTGKTSPLG